jgi:multiple antibiotic resistance protein
MLDIPEYVQLLAALVAITNPIGKIPVFTALTGHRSEADKQRIALIAAVTVVAILLVCFFVGEVVLRALGITISAFRIAGGILLLLSALTMMSGTDDGASPATGTARETDAAAVAVVPLATPLLAGPGAISAVIVYAHRHDSLGHILLVVAAIFGAGAVILVVFRLAPLLASVLRRTGMNVAGRITGLILAATAVEFIVDGIAAHFPGLLK